MKRRDFLKTSAAAGLFAASPSLAPARSTDGASGAAASRHEPGDSPNPLTPPAKGSIPVAFLISEGAVVIDFCGPWEVFHETNVPGREEDAFQLYTVGASTAPVRVSGGMKITPDFDFVTAPPPKVIVIPAQPHHTDATLAWLRAEAKRADVTMSVCTGASLLASAGLLSGKSATTHHAAYRSLAREFPDVRVKRGARFVEAGNVATSGGLSSGIDLAFRVVERYFGRDVAAATAYQMEYQGQGWLNPESNALYAKIPTSTDAHPLCPVCEMEVDPKTSPKSVFRGRSYAFCSTDHQRQFDAAPAKWID
jgi:putative intracellular protease/amidase/YHS domain-containing protein